MAKSVKKGIIVSILFSGEYFKTLDAKGRLSLPSEFRKQLSESDKQLVLTKNLEGGLTAFPGHEWQKFTEQLEKIPAGKKRNAINRLYLAPKTNTLIDKQGRLPLSPAQRKWLGLTDDSREIVLIGNYRRIDIFSPERYQDVVLTDVALLKENEELINQNDLP